MKSTKPVVECLVYFFNECVVKLVVYYTTLYNEAYTTIINSFLHVIDILR